MAEHKITILENTRTYFRFQSIWPKSKNDSSGRLVFGPVFYVKFLLQTMASAILLWGSGAHLVVTLYKKTGGEIYTDLPVIVSIVGTYYYNCVFVVNIKPIAEALRDLSNFKLFGKPPGMDEFNKRLNTYARYYQTYICVVVIFLCVPSLLDRKMCVKHNIEKGLNEVCGLVTNVWFPFDVDYFPVKHIIFVAQLYSAYFSYGVSATVTFSQVECTEHVIFRLLHLRDLFLEAISEKDMSIRKPLLRKCVDYHNSIIRTGDTLSNAYSLCVFVHVLFTGAILACSGFQLLHEVQLKCITLLLGWFLALVICAYSAQRITDTSMELQDTIYNTEWYDLEVETQKDILLVLLRFNKLMYVKTGPFGVMSYQVVLSILKTSYSILSLLTGTS